jgi:hypothetical protein
MLVAGHLGPIERLAPLLRGQAACLQQMNRDPLLGEPCGEGETGNACTDDADVAFKVSGQTTLLKIDMQWTDSRGMQWIC